MALDDDVADLLTRSIFHHRAALVLRNRFLVGALVELIRARNFRKDAINLDPNHTVPAWRDEEKAFYRGISDALMQFYARHIP